MRYGVRTLLKSPGFTLAALVALALGIGANSAMFGIVNAVLLRPIPYPQPDRLVAIYSSNANFKRSSVSYPNFLDWRRHSRSFDLMAAYRSDNFNLTGQAEPERLLGRMASATVFEAIGVRPLIGRTFTDAEDRQGAAPVAVLTSSLWKSRFGGSPEVLGQSLLLNDTLYTVIGVVPSDDVVLQRAALVVPIGQWAEPIFRDRGVAMGMRVIGHLRPGVALQQGQAELDGIAAGLAHEFPKEDKASGIYAVSFRDDFLGDVRTPLLVLLVIRHHSAGATIEGCDSLVCAANSPSAILFFTAADGNRGVGQRRRRRSVGRPNRAEECVKNGWRPRNVEAPTKRPELGGGKAKAGVVPRLSTPTSARKSCIRWLVDSDVQSRADRISRIGEDNAHV